MPLLGVVPGGKLLEPPIQLSTRCDKTHEALRAQIVGKLLPAQREFVDEVDVKIVGYCAGFGAGKTHALCAKAVVMAMDNPGTVGAVFEPTHIMIRDVWMRSFDDFLEAEGIEHDFRGSPRPEYTLCLPDGPCALLCRASSCMRFFASISLFASSSSWLKAAISSAAVAAAAAAAASAAPSP